MNSANYNRSQGPSFSGLLIIIITAIFLIVQQSARSQDIQIKSLPKTGNTDSYSLSRTQIDSINFAFGLCSDAYDVGMNLLRENRILRVQVSQYQSVVDETKAELADERKKSAQYLEDYVWEKTEASQCDIALKDCNHNVKMGVWEKIGIGIGAAALGFTVGTVMK